MIEVMLDLLILLAFVIYAVWVGFLHRRSASRTLEEYFLAGRTLTGWRAGFSMAATQYAADTPLLVAGLVATAGIFALWRLWVYGIAAFSPTSAANRTTSPTGRWSFSM